MKIYHYIVIEGKLSSFVETTLLKAKIKGAEHNCDNLPNKLKNKGVFVYSYNDHQEEVKGHVICLDQEEAKQLITSIK